MRISNPQVFGGGKLITVDETNEKLQSLKTEIEHTSNGDSIVYVAVEAASGDAGADPKDTTSFIATGFVKSDGSKITLLGSQAI